MELFYQNKIMTIAGGLYFYIDDYELTDQTYKMHLFDC